MSLFMHETPGAKKYTGQQVLYLQQKYDGHRVTAFKQQIGDDRPLILYTRNQTNLFPELIEKAHACNIWHWIVDLLALPSQTSIDGELYVPGEPASYVKTAIKNNDPALKFAAFAVPWVENVRMYAEPLEWAMDQATHFRIPFIPFVKLDKPMAVDPVTCLEDASEETEGWVAKRLHYAQWYKIKRVHTMDVIATGVTKGCGKYSGQIGALRGSVYNQNDELREICLCSGMTDQERSQMSNKDVGRVFEVKYQEAAALGRLRHPSFVRWRDDKPHIQCTMAQEPILLKYWERR